MEFTMFFKKQAFKIKDLLKEKGVEIPLVTIQEILAKSYGFNNRHVALTNEGFNQQLNALHKLEKTFIPAKDNSIYDLPQYLTRENINDYSFWWNESGDDFCIHNLDTSPGNPFSDDYFYKELDIIIYEKKGDQLIPTFLSYTYNEKKDCLELNTSIRSFLKFKGLKPVFKNFKSLDITKDEIILLDRGNVSWDDTKKILAHKDCPLELCKKYAKDKDFYVRICAIFSKPHRDELYILAKTDSDPRVRRYYYTYMIDVVDNIETLREEIKKDGKVNNVLGNIKFMNKDGKYEPLINW